MSVVSSVAFDKSLNALAMNPSASLVAVGGREVLKVVELTGAAFGEVKTLRKGRGNLNLSTNDVQWHPRERKLLVGDYTHAALRSARVSCLRITQRRDREHVFRPLSRPLCPSSPPLLPRPP